MMSGTIACLCTSLCHSYLLSITILHHHTSTQGSRTLFVHLVYLHEHVLSEPMTTLNLQIVKLAGTPNQFTQCSAPDCTYCIQFTDNKPALGHQFKSPFRQHIAATNIKIPQGPKPIPDPLNARIGNGTIFYL